VSAKRRKSQGVIQDEKIIYTKQEFNEMKK
jgi:hypothetical protein